jgi:YtxH-like protein
MSYAGKVARRGPASAQRTTPEAPNRGASPYREDDSARHEVARSRTPRGSPVRHEIPWKKFSSLAAAALFGLALGASVALLFAPRSGKSTRRAIRRRVRRLGDRTRDGWSELRDELQRARLKRKSRRESRRCEELAT